MLMKYWLSVMIGCPFMWGTPASLALISGKRDINSLGPYSIPNAQCVRSQTCDCPFEHPPQFCLGRRNVLLVVRQRHPTDGDQPGESRCRLPAARNMSAYGLGSFLAIVPIISTDGNT